VLFILRVGLTWTIRVTAHTVKGQRLNTFGKSGVQVTIFDPTVGIEQEVAAEPLRDGG
jgi:hypothetical protein